MTYEKTLKHEEATLDEALRESFPASDPVAVSFDPVADEDEKPDDATAGVESPQGKKANVWTNA